MQPFPNLYKAFGTIINNQNPIFASPDCREKGVNSSARKNKEIGHKIQFPTKIQINFFVAYNTFFGVCTKKFLLKIREKISIKSSTKRFEKKSIIGMFFMWTPFFISQTNSLPFYISSALRIKPVYNGVQNISRRENQPKKSKEGKLKELIA